MGPRRGVCLWAGGFLGRVEEPLGPGGPLVPYCRNGVLGRLVGVGAGLPGAGPAAPPAARCPKANGSLNPRPAGLGSSMRCRSSGFFEGRLCRFVVVLSAWGVCGGSAAPLGFGASWRRACVRRQRPDPRPRRNQPRGGGTEEPPGCGGGMPPTKVVPACLCPVLS